MFAIDIANVMHTQPLPPTTLGTELSGSPLRTRGSSGWNGSWGPAPGTLRSRRRPTGWRKRHRYRCVRNLGANLTRASRLERLRRGPTSVTAAGLLGALDRLSEVISSVWVSWTCPRYRDHVHLERVGPRRAERAPGRPAGRLRRVTQQRDAGLRLRRQQQRRSRPGPRDPALTPRDVGRAVVPARLRPGRPLVARAAPGPGPTTHPERPTVPAL